MQSPGKREKRGLPIDEFIFWAFFEALLFLEDRLPLAEIKTRQEQAHAQVQAQTSVLERTKSTNRARIECAKCGGSLGPLYGYTSLSYCTHTLLTKLLCLGFFDFSLDSRFSIPSLLSLPFRSLGKRGSTADQITTRIAPMTRS
jgi:hypothetical protein